MTIGKPAAQVVIEELQDDVQSPEDQEIVDEFKAELAIERAEILVEPLGQLASREDGTVDRAEVIDAERAAGQNSGPYGDANRRA